MLARPHRSVDSATVTLTQSNADLSDVALALNSATLTLVNSTWWVGHVC